LQVKQHRSGALSVGLPKIRIAVILVGVVVATLGFYADKATS
jgi:hypothetical protein